MALLSGGAGLGSALHMLVKECGICSAAGRALVGTDLLPPLL